MLRSGIWGTSQHREIEGYSSRPMGHICKDNGYHIPRGDKDLRFPQTSTANDSAIKSWSTMMNRIRAQARDQYNRELSLDKRIQYVHDYLMATVWHVAQIFPLHEDCVRKLNTSISWFLQNREEEGGWGLINLQAKCLALFIYRTLIQSQRDGTLSAEWMREWSLSEQSTKPPFRERIPTALGYLRRHGIESAYVATQG